FGSWWFRALRFGRTLTTEKQRNDPCYHHHEDQNAFHFRNQSTLRPIFIEADNLFARLEAIAKLVLLAVLLTDSRQLFVVVLAQSEINSAPGLLFLQLMEKGNSEPRIMFLVWPALLHLEQTRSDFVVRVAQRFDEQHAKRHQCD